MVKGLKLLLLFLISLSFGVEILSERLIRDEEGNLIAEGSVEVRYGKLLVRAERIKYDPESRTLFATGKVYVRSEDHDLEVRGSEAFIDLRTEEGYFLDAEGRFRKFYFSARKIRKIGENEYLVEEGEITTCPPEDKEMKLCFGKARIDSRYVFSYDNSLKLFNVPIGYLPIAVFPVGERRSGLLPPMIGQSTYSNLIYIQPVYWAISRDKDATLTFDYRDRQAKGIWIEYRQALSVRERIYARFSYYREPTPPREWWRGRPVRTFKEDRYRAQLELSWRGWRLGLDIPSDPYFFEDVYFSREERTVPYTLSYITYASVERDYLLFLNLRGYYDLTFPDNRRTLNLLPEVSFYSRPRRVGSFFVSLTTSFVNFYREAGLRSRRLIFLPQFQLPFELLGIRSFASLEIINNFYFTEGADKKDNRVTSFRFENRVPLHSSLSVGSLLLSNTAELVYTFSPENFDNPQFDTFDQITRENNLRLRLSSSLFYNGRTLSTLFLEGGFNALGSYRFPTDGTLVEEELLPVRAILSVYPAEWVSLSEDVTYDPNLNIMARGVSSLRFRLGRTTFSGSYVVSRDSLDRRLTDQFTLEAETDLKGLLLGGSITRDNLTDRDIYRRVFLGYRGACWSVRGDYRQTYYGEKGYLNEIFLIFTAFNLQDLILPLRRR